MKKYLVVLFVSFAFIISGFSFNASAKDDSKKAKKVVTEEKKADKKDKKEAKKESKKEEKADKKADKKEDKKSKKEEKAEKKAEKKEAKAVSHNKAADEKELGKDDKGRMIYEGPRGGQYYYTDHNTKVYLKKDDKK